LHHLHSFLSLTHLENGDSLRASELTVVKFQAKIQNCMYIISTLESVIDVGQGINVGP
jgi:hypothetical protein